MESVFNAVSIKQQVKTKKVAFHLIVPIPNILKPMAYAFNVPHCKYPPLIRRAVNVPKGPNNYQMEVVNYAQTIQ